LTVQDRPALEALLGAGFPRTAAADLAVLLDQLRD
jgi:hypothetical protein